MASRVKVDDDRLAQAAFWYYVQDLSQEEVARRLGTSRSNVSRLLRAARERGIIKFEVVYPTRRDLRLEEALRARYALNDVIVATAPSNGAGGPKTTLLAAARAGADWLGSRLQDGDLLGLFWGGTVQALVDAAHFDHRVDAHVIQLGGEWSNDSNRSGHNLVRDLAVKLGGRYTYFNAPAFAPTAEAADAILDGPQIRALLDLARSATLAVVGVGAFLTDTTRMFLDQANASPEEVAEAEQRGVVGQIAGRFFDADGGQVDLALHHRLVSLDLAEVRRIETIVVVASGTSKVRAVQGAVRGGLVDVLVVDAGLASALLTSG